METDFWNGIQFWTLAMKTIFRYSQARPPGVKLVIKGTQELKVHRIGRVALDLRSFADSVLLNPAAFRFGGWSREILYGVYETGCDRPRGINLSS